jgi:hypothetical protein
MNYLDIFCDSYTKVGKRQLRNPRMADVYATSSTGIAAATGDASIHVINDKSFSWIKAVTLAKLLECEMWSIKINKILGGDFIVFFRVRKSQFHPKIISFINFIFCIRLFLIKSFCLKISTVSWRKTSNSLQNSVVSNINEQKRRISYVL